MTIEVGKSYERIPRWAGDAPDFATVLTLYPQSVSYELHNALGERVGQGLMSRVRFARIFREPAVSR